MDGSVTIDELARDCGVATTTVRMYQHRGLLPPPERRGRVGYYGLEHRRRLGVIANLQQRGYSLAAIRELLDAWEEGLPLSDVLGVDEAAPGLMPPAVRVTPEEVAARFEGIHIAADDWLRAIDLGLVELDGDEVVVLDPSFLDAGPRIARLGVPVGEILDEYEALQASVAAVAGRFRKVFDRHLWQPVEDRGLPEDELARLSDDAQALASAASEVVIVELRRQFGEFVDDYLDRARKTH